MVVLLLRRFDGSTLSFRCDEEKSIFDVKRHIESIEGIPCSLQSLSLNGFILGDCDNLGDCCNSDIAQVDLNVDVMGGAKKRKKKVYTTPKKIKRKPKKVEPNGKLNRLRRECPNKECGAGVFMASHFDREYCVNSGVNFTRVYCRHESGVFLCRASKFLHASYGSWIWEFPIFLAERNHESAGICRVLSILA
ncbi:Ubiquitin-like protein 1-40S ribosomal protein S27a [Taenia crassiceps]|uniref:Ubiquitin-like protein 1-40S ribosomal protein S27a n=1 Tax=Taenia crassiceps TaxID=6207 RepID=A0ABR4QNZ4_9CEST